MEIIGTIVIGFIVGLIARFVKPGDDSAGIIVTTLIGIVGAFVGTFVGRALGMYEQNEAAGFIMAILGSILVLFVFKKVAPKRTA